MRNCQTYITACLASLMMFAAVARAETKSGDVTLKKQDVFDMPVSVQVGTKVHAACKFRSDDFFHQSVIIANADLENTSDKPMYYVSNVAFFDVDHHMIGCTSQGSMGQPLKAGEKTQLGSCIIFAPAAEIAKVKSYQVTWYETPNKGDL
jgi:hypothetical protein